MSNTLATGTRVLCIDGGGIRGLSEILILKELMLQVRIQSKLDFTPEPWQCFDLICGTSTGGLLALLLGRLGKTLDECEQIFRGLGSQIFTKGSLAQKARLAFKGSRYASEGLKKLVGAETGDQIMYEASSVTGHVPVSSVWPSYVAYITKALTFKGLGDRRCKDDWKAQSVPDIWRPRRAREVQSSRRLSRNVCRNNFL
jgi:hypothetical protein